MKENVCTTSKGTFRTDINERTTTAPSTLIEQHFVGQRFEIKEDSPAALALVLAQFQTLNRKLHFFPGKKESVTVAGEDLDYLILLRQSRIPQ